MNEREREICSRVKLFREQIKWPQSAFAYEVGMTRDQLASIEYGRTPLRYSTAFMICQVFDVSMDWLASGKGAVQPFDHRGPFAGNLPPTMLLSEVYATAMKTAGSLAGVRIQTKSAAEKERRRERKEVSPPKGNVAAVTLAKIADALQGCSFDNHEQETSFCELIEHSVRSAIMRHKTKRASERIRRGGGVKNFRVANEADLSGFPHPPVKTALSLQAEIEDLEAKLAALREEFKEIRVKNS